MVLELVRRNKRRIHVLSPLDGIWTTYRFCPTNDSMYQPMTSTYSYIRLFRIQPKRYLTLPSSLQQAMGVANGIGSGSNGSSSSNGSHFSGSSGSSGGGGGGGLFPNLQCGPTNRRGRRLFGRPKAVHPPSSCQGTGASRGAALCDEPGDDYPW